jgi:trehalose 6-phosphate synthase
MSKKTETSQASDRGEQTPLIVIISNRGPYQFEENEDGSFTSKRGAGGLVTALMQLAQQMDVLWIAAALSEGDEAWAKAQGNEVANVEGINMRLVITDHDAYYQYYNVIANPLLWFIQHGMWDMTRSPVIDASIWEAWRDGYAAINQQFAEVVAASIDKIQAKLPEGTTRPVIIMPQDYHLYLLPQYLREKVGWDVQIQPFVHIPWPGIDGWRILPAEMRDAVIRSLLHSDRVGFQTQRDAFNFVQTARFYVDNAHSYGARDSITYNERKVGAYTYPISIDVDKVEQLLTEPLAQLYKGQMISQIGDRKVILRVDRVEPSKNILRGLQAFRALLETYPEHHGKVQMLALLVPSRMEVDEYQTYLRDIMAESGMINAQFSDEFWEPVRIIVGNNYHRALAAMQLYDVLLVNPLADGMNLVAKEGPLVNDRDGVLVLSEHAGAFYELGEHALTVSPFDVYSTAKAMHEALTMPSEERQTRAEALRKIIQKAGVREWFFHQVDDALKSMNDD